MLDGPRGKNLFFMKMSYLPNHMDLDLHGIYQVKPPDKTYKLSFCWVWWHMLLFPVLGRKRCFACMPGTQEVIGSLELELQL